jgi:cell wall-associated NlpC family hydrolase
VATAAQIVSTAQKFAVGVNYVFGAENTASTTAEALRQARAKGIDCSELVEVVCRIHQVRPTVPDGAYYQWRHCKPCSIDTAIRTPGAMLFIGDGRGVGRDAITHCAISKGNGTTMEARGARYGVGNWSAKGRGWSFAGILPGVSQSAQVRPPAPPNLAAISRGITAAKRHTLGIGRPNPKSAVIWCQSLLNNKLAGNILTVDGTYGWSTYANVAAFQRAIRTALRISPASFKDKPGVVGPTTWFWLTRPGSIVMR